MRIERDLLKRFMIELTTEEDVVSLFNDIKECLAQPEQDKAEAVMPNGVCVSNVYDAYEEGRKSVMSEQEPVAWKVIDVTNGEYMFSRVKPMERSYKYDVVIPLYTSAQKREPFEPEERQRLSKAYSTRAEQVAFEEGIIFAEISYGIGVDNESI